MIRQPDFGEPPRAPRGGEGTTVSTFSHVPVLHDAVLQALMPGPGKFFVDGTLGGGGHTEALLEAGAFVLGIDQDPEAIAHTSQKLSRYGTRFKAVHGSFGDVAEILGDLKLDLIDGALLDLGVSSHQLDTPVRGFSFQVEGPLDMRMNTQGPVTARDLVNTASAEQLERIFREFGEEPQARRIAMRIARDRGVKSLDSTLDLARCVESIVPRQGNKTHPATRVFQALRIAVNRELEILSRGLEGFTSRLAPGGRFAVISFHSLEDRVVKRFFQHRSSPSVDRPEWSAPRANPDYCLQKITGKPVVASDAEQRFNARSRSAKLRVVERLRGPNESAFPSHSPP